MQRDGPRDGPEWMLDRDSNSMGAAARSTEQFVGQIALRPESQSALRAVRAALGTVRQRARADVVHQKEEYLDLVTGTDLQSQAVIADVLTTAHPLIPFVGEETTTKAPETGSYWLVDPICGTRNFSARVPYYSVNVALVDNGAVTVGVVGDGATEEVWCAERGNGAWKVQGDRFTPVHVSEGSGMVCLDPGRPRVQRPEPAAKVLAAAIMSEAWELRVLGSSLDLAYLAEGRLAAVWHFSRIAPLHFAAGVLLATEAAAIVTDERGEPWQLAASGVVAAATSSLHRQLLALQ